LFFFLINVYHLISREEKSKKTERRYVSLFVFNIAHTHAQSARARLKKKKSDDFIDRVAIQSRRRGIGSKTREKDELGESVHDEWWCF